MRSLEGLKLAQAVDRLYEAAAHPALWREALHAFSLAAGAEGTLLLSHTTQRPARLVCSEGLDASIATFVNDGWHTRNQAIQRAQTAPQNAPVQTEWLLFSSEEYRRDPFHQEFLRPHGFAWFAGMFVARSAAATVTLSPQRRSCDEPFSRRETDLLAKVLPHIRRAGQLALAVGEARSGGALDAFSLLEVPAMLLDHSGAVRRLNGDAHALLGRGLDVVQQRLTARQPAITTALRRLIDSVIRAGPAHETAALGPVSVPRPGGRPLLVHAAPLVGAGRDVFQTAGAVLTIVDPDAGRAQAELLLGRCWGLTPAEAATAAALAAGLDLRQTAARRGVGLETVRSQVKSIGVKTGARGRGTQVALFNRTLAAVPQN